MRAAARQLGPSTCSCGPLLAVALAACSSTSQGSGGNADAGPPADAFVAATVGAGTGSVSCPLMGAAVPWLSIGMPTAGKPVAVDDGGSSGSGSVSVACTVHPSRSGFDVNLSAVLQGPQGASMTITTPTGQGAVTTSGAMGVTATFSSSQQGGPYTQGDCALTFEYQGQPVPVDPAVAAGRIWGHISCTAAVLSGQPGKRCDAEADFLFEQCGE